MATTNPPAKAKAKLKYKIPKTTGGAIDLLWGVREERKKLDALAALEKDQETMIESAIFAMFGKSELEGAKGKAAQCSIKRSDVPTPDDWAKIEKHIKKTGEFDLMQRRLSVEAVRARWSAKKAIPGVGVFTKVGLSLTKR